VKVCGSTCFGISSVSSVSSAEGRVATDTSVVFGASVLAVLTDRHCRR
jgi:hypothetical protein